MASIALEGIEKAYSDGSRALAGIDLELREGELLVVVGPSGCGKSTLLRVVAGLEAPTAGRVRIGEHDVTDRTPGERDLAMVFQSYALYPHFDVLGNLAFGLRMRGVSRAERERRARAAAARLGIEARLGRRPSELSGGQRQRVALGRALVREPAAFLLDEPLSNLDARLRGEMRVELARLHRSLGTTMLYVTHDQEEAMTLGDRIAVLRGGRVEQVGPPREIYRAPRTAFVADFLGSPSINWIEGELAREAPGRLAFLGPGLRLPLPEGPDRAPTPGPGPESGADPADVAPEPDGRRLRLGIRPEDVERIGDPPSGATDGLWRGRVELVEMLGASALVHARSSAGGELRWLAPAERPPGSGRPIAFRVRADRCHLFDATTGLRWGDGAEPERVRRPGAW